jgi:hypothetical protein
VVGRFCDVASPTPDLPPGTIPSQLMSAFSLYKARRVPTKSPVCAICVDRTRGTTRQVGFGYGVSVWLCQAHASVEFITGRGGRDLVVTLLGIWRANGCLTSARHKALDAHLAALKPQPQPERARPGSYAWPKLRVHAEQLFANGTTATTVHTRIHHATFTNAEPPSRRTIRRRHAQQRWLHPPPRAA